MNLNNLIRLFLCGPYRNLQLRYGISLTLFVLGCILICAYPIWKIAVWLAEYYNISHEGAVKDQANGWLWGFLFLAEAVAIFSIFYGSVAFVFAKYKGWSNETYFNVFWKNKFPLKWYK